jgi:hypothetical protein
MSRAVPRPSPSLALAGACLGLLLASSPARAHDLWLVPEPEAPGPARRVLVTQGMDFGKSDGAIEVRRLERPEVWSPKGVRAELRPGRPRGQAAVMLYDAAEPGVWVLGAETTPKKIELAAADFNHYLVADGMPHVFRERWAAKELDRSAVEQYGKSVKALLRVPGGPSAGWDRVLGHRLELVPLDDPFGTPIGRTLRVRVLFRGAPLAGARVGWQFPSDGDEPNGHARTGADGVVHVPISRSGPMSLRLTHMTRPRAEDHEWASWWTTLSFHVP